MKTVKSVHVKVDRHVGRDRGFIYWNNSVKESLETGP